MKFTIRDLLAVAVPALFFLCVVPSALLLIFANQPKPIFKCRNCQYEWYEHIRGETQAIACPSCGAGEYLHILRRHYDQSHPLPNSQTPAPNPPKP